MAITVALAGDTMLGRGVAEHLSRHGTGALFAPEIEHAVAEADLFLVNLECCISEGGAPYTRIPGKPFFFRAPPLAAKVLAGLGVDGACLANDHALDFGPEALLDTRAALTEAGIRAVGAGADETQARAATVFERRGLRIGVMAATDHPEQFAARGHEPGVAFADLKDAVPAWLTDGVRELREHTDLTLVTVHWGPNMVDRPVRHVRHAAAALVDAGADLVIGHCAHVFHGFTRRVLFDLGDFIDDYRVDPILRNDLGLLWLVTFEGHRPVRTRAIPIAVDGCRTRLADPFEYARIRFRLDGACAPFGTRIEDRGDFLDVTWPE
ncbi:CapA family protein [Actinocrinis puniceicyclus]|uniref:CapA family protein n=1 Tax=Actinocrinis puniceicyclus TaxID=977794 RepID=A0A8J7WQR7_9ACTN|nr:CapA family protein [Actinocrinis puniceicyclus]MBS2966763.1 CapA family protein [Actinocrinis puniceicyclus]